MDKIQPQLCGVLKRPTRQMNSRGEEESLMLKDNFYNRQTLACKLYEMSDGECKVSTDQFNNIYAVNKIVVKDTMLALKTAKMVRGGCIRLSTKLTKPEYSGLFLFEDLSVTKFYSYDQADTRNLWIHKYNAHGIRLNPLQ